MKSDVFESQLRIKLLVITFALILDLSAIPDII